MIMGSFRVAHSKIVFREGSHKTRNRGLRAFRMRMCLMSVLGGIVHYDTQSKCAPETGAIEVKRTYPNFKLHLLSQGFPAFQIY